MENNNDVVTATELEDSAEIDVSRYKLLPVDLPDIEKPDEVLYDITKMISNSVKSNRPESSYTKPQINYSRKMIRNLIKHTQLDEQIVDDLLREESVRPDNRKVKRLVANVTGARRVGYALLTFDWGNLTTQNRGTPETDTNVTLPRDKFHAIPHLAAKEGKTEEEIKTELMSQAIDNRMKYHYVGKDRQQKLNEITKPPMAEDEDNGQSDT